jgi:hypothetical protein
MHGNIGLCTTPKCKQIAINFCVMCLIYYKKIIQIINNYKAINKAKIIVKRLKNKVYCNVLTEAITIY